MIKKKIKADAIITNQKRLPIAVLTADCVPLLLYDSKEEIIAAIHAGWKGAFKGIINKILQNCYILLKNLYYDNSITISYKYQSI